MKEQMEKQQYSKNQEDLLVNILRINSLISKVSFHFVSVSTLWGQKRQVVKKLLQNNYFQIVPDKKHKNNDQINFFNRFTPVMMAELSPQDQAETEISFFWILPDLSILVIDFDTKKTEYVSYSKAKHFLMASGIPLKSLRTIFKEKKEQIN